MNIDNLLFMDKFRDYFNKNKPRQIKKEDTFQIKNYHLIIREFSQAYEAHKLPGQDYEEKHIYIKNYLESNEKNFDHSKYFCPLYFITVVPEEELKEASEKDIVTERIVYIGETKDNESRFKKGHLATQLLNLKDYDEYYKFIFMTQVFIEYEHTTAGNKYNYIVPLELFEKLLPFDWVNNNYGFVTQIIYYLEKYLIFNIRPELNTKDNPIAYWLSKQEITQPNLLNTKEITPEKIYVNRINYNYYPTNLLSNIELVQYIKDLDHYRDEQRDEFLKIGISAYTKTDFLNYFQEALSYNLINKDDLKKLKKELRNSLLSDILKSGDIDSIL